MLPMALWAQEERAWSKYLNEVMTVEDVESSQWEDATREQLEELPFLAAQQIEELVEYRERYGPMKSLGELLMIRSLSYGQRQLLTAFVFVGEEPTEGFPSLQKVFQNGRHELMTTARIPFYKRRGDNDGYLGYPYRHWLRYQFTSGDAVKAGIVGAQDAGEPFFANRNRWGYDYYSLYSGVDGHGTGDEQRLLARKGGDAPVARTFYPQPQGSQLS